MKKSKTKAFIAVTIIACLVISALIISFADGNTPGSEQDPVVTLSYVTKVADQLKGYIDAAISTVYKDISVLNTNTQTNLNEINSLKTQLEQKDKEIAKLNESVTALQSQINNTAAATYEVILLKKGTILEAGKGAEIIVRSGKCTAIASVNGGMADATEGKDLKQDESVTLNHLLIASRGDGRGIKALEDSYIIVRGSYTLK